LYQNCLSFKLFQNILTSFVVKQRVFCGFLHKSSYFCFVLPLSCSFSVQVPLPCGRAGYLSRHHPAVLVYKKSEPCSTFTCRPYHKLASFHFVGPP
jgi:hypothetical protein